MEQSTLALAGIFQAVELVRQVAQQGLLDQAPFESSINSILKVDADSVEEIYGGINGVNMGLKVLQSQLNGSKQGRNMDLLRYALGIIVLERKLIKQPAMLKTMSSGIEQANRQASLCHITDTSVLEVLAHLYSKTLSTFNYRIQVTGEPRYLQSAHNANKIRSLLLAGIRSAVLWQQKGGRRWQLLFSRKKIAYTAERLLLD